MPIISQFYGILVQIFFEKEGKHNLKHIHVRYNEYKACYDLDGNLIEGKLPIKQKVSRGMDCNTQRRIIFIMGMCTK